MSKYSICILDDKLPVNQLNGWFEDNNLLSHNNFKLLMELVNEKDWEEKQLFQLISSLYSKSDTFELFGFVSHSFFLNYIDDNIFSPDIVIFDWDVGEIDPKQNLLNILQKKYCLIAVYTGADTLEEIRQTIEDNEFDNYRDRLFLKIKGEENSVKTLEDEIDKRKNIFSFNLNKTLKQNTIQGIDKILINIGKLSFNQFVSLFGENKEGQKELAQIDFIDIFLEKLKYELTSIGLDDVELKTPNENIDDINKIRELWHYRMYHKTGDNIIRKGDVIKKENELFLVIASDCHLKEFWKKSLGYLTVIPLHKISADNDKLKNILSYDDFQIDSYKLSSLVNPRGIDFLTVLPALINDDNDFLDYALNPREINSIFIDLVINYNDETDPQRKKDIKKNAISQPLKTSDGDFKYIISLSEPFLSGLFQFVSENFSGFGLPDFSDDLVKSIREKLKELK